MVYTYNGILFSLEKEGNPVTCYDMDVPGEHYAKKIASHKKINTVQSHLHQESKVVKFIEAESRMLVTSGWGRGK